MGFPFIKACDITYLFWHISLTNKCILECILINQKTNISEVTNADDFKSPHDFSYFTFYIIHHVCEPSEIQQDTLVGICWKRDLIFKISCLLFPPISVHFIYAVKTPKI